MVLKRNKSLETYFVHHDGSISVFDIGYKFDFFVQLHTSSVEVVHLRQLVGAEVERVVF